LQEWFPTWKSLWQSSKGLGGGIDTKGGLIFGKKLKLGNLKGIEPLYAQAEARAVRREKVQKRVENHMMIVQL